MNTMISNPYIGPRTFETKDSHLFFGREREALDLLSLVISDRLVLFYAQSGAGKSSLINTKLIPGLRAEEDYNILPVGRVGGGDSVVTSRIENVYAFNLITSLQPDVRRDILTKVTISKFLSGLEINKRTSEKHVLIIDQFEELFSSHNEAWEKREGFFRQLAQALADFPNLWVVLVMREDYIAHLDPYVNLLPGRLRVRYYMQRLEHDAALRAIKEPAQFSRPFDDGVAEKLALDLAGMRIQQPDGTTLAQAGQFVEPVQLQVVCYNLWQSLSPGETITQQDLDRVGDVGKALEDHYANRVREVVAKKGVYERAVREWFGSRLITSSGVRNLVAQEQGGKSGLADEVIQEFVKSGDLVRVEHRGGTTFYELTHDRLVEPILKNNKTWEDAHISILQRQARLWHEQGRTEGLLVRGQDLIKLEKEAKPGITQQEVDFLNACRRLRSDELRNRQRNRWMAIFALGATVALIVAVFFSYLSNQSKEAAQSANLEAATSLANANYANTQSAYSLSTAEASKLEAEQQRARADLFALPGIAQQLTEQSQAQLDVNYNLAKLLGIEAYRIWPNSASVVANLGLYMSSPNLLVSLNFHRGSIYSMAYAPERKILASAGSDHDIIVLDMSDLTAPKQVGIISNAHESLITSLAFSPDGNTLVSGSLYEIALWDISGDMLYTPERLGIEYGHPTYVWSLAFLPDGQTLVSTDFLDKRIFFWDVSALKYPELDFTIELPYSVQYIAINPQPGANLLASASSVSISSDEIVGVITLFDLNNPSTPLQSALVNGRIRSIAFSPDGKTLVTGGDKKLVFWDVSVPESIYELRSFSDANLVTALGFSPDGRRLASASDDQTIKIWDVDNSLNQVGAPLRGHRGRIASIFLINSEGNILVSGGVDKTIKIWDTSEPRAPFERGEIINDSFNEISSIAFHPALNLIAIGNANTNVGLWDVPSSGPSNKIAELINRSESMISVAFSLDGEYLAVGCEDGTVILWNVKDLDAPVKVAELTEHTGAVNSLAFNPASDYLASGSTDETIVLWSVKEPGMVGILTMHNKPVNSVVFSADGILASASADEQIILWNVGDPANPQILNSLPRVHPSGVSIIAFNPKRNMLASAGSIDSKIVLWDISDPESPVPFDEVYLLGSVKTMSFSSDGRMLAAGFADNSVLLWGFSELPDEMSNQLLSLPIQMALPLALHSNAITSVAFSFDNKILASGSKDGTVRLWDVDPASWVNQICGVVQRNLTRLEWLTYLPSYIAYPLGLGDEKYVACPGFPLDTGVPITATP